MANIRSGVPVDRGWAWVVLAGCVLEITVYGGILKCFGIFFIQYQIQFNSNAYQTVVMSLVQNAVLSLSSVFVMTIGLRKFSSRQFVFAGGVVTVIGYLLTAFTTKLSVYYFGQGFLCGLGLSLIHAPELAIICTYFKKHKALANAMFTGGSAIGGLIFAPIVVKLFDEYQYSGAMLIVSGLLMNIGVGALLMRPLEFYTRNNGKIENGCLGRDSSKEIMKETPGADKSVNNSSEKDVQPKGNYVRHGDTARERIQLSSSLGTVISKVNYDLKTSNTFHGQDELLLQRPRSLSVGCKIPNDTFDLKSNYGIYYSRGRLRAFVESISNVLARSDGVCASSILVSSSPDIADAECKKLRKSSHRTVKKGLFSFLGTILDFHLMQNPVFLMFLLITFTFMTSHTIVPNFIPAHAKEVGITNENIGILTSVLAVVGLFARITVGLVVDRELIKLPTLLALMAFLTGTGCHLLRFVDDFSSLLIFVILVGFCCGQFDSLFAVLLLDIVGHERLNSSLGLGTLVRGLSAAVFFPVTGLLRDDTGSYIAPYHMLGGLAYVSGGLVLLNPKIKAWYEARTTMETLVKQNQFNQETLENN